MKFKIITFFIILNASNAMAIESVALANKQQIEQALSVFKNWITLYQKTDYIKQFLLVHPRIQKYKKRDMNYKALGRFGMQGLIG